MEVSKVMVVPTKHPKSPSDHLSIEPHGDFGIHHFKTPPPYNLAIQWGYGAYNGKIIYQYLCFMGSKRVFQPSKNRDFFWWFQPVIWFNESTQLLCSHQKEVTIVGFGPDQLLIFGHALKIQWLLMGLSEMGYHDGDTITEYEKDIRMHPYDACVCLKMPEKTLKK